MIIYTNNANGRVVAGTTYVNSYPVSLTGTSVSSKPFLQTSPSEVDLAGVVIGGSGKPVALTRSSSLPVHEYENPRLLFHQRLERSSVLDGHHILQPGARIHLDRLAKSGNKASICAIHHSFCSFWGALRWSISEKLRSLDQWR